MNSKLQIKKKTSPEKRALATAHSVFSWSLLPRPPFIQPKLAISRPDDEYEREADRVAQKVMNMPERQEDEDTGENRRPYVAKKVLPIKSNILAGHDLDSSGKPEARVQAAVNSSGQHLSPSVRRFFEPRFGYNFSSVRVHTDGRGTEAARAVNARAFTVGRDLVFGQGQYAPFSSKGKVLLAHELTHSLQQGQGGSAATTLLVQRAPEISEEDLRKLPIDQLEFRVRALHMSLQKTVSTEFELHQSILVDRYQEKFEKLSDEGLSDLQAQARGTAIRHGRDPVAQIKLHVLTMEVGYRSKYAEFPGGIAPLHIRGVEGAPPSFPLERVKYFQKVYGKPYKEGLGCLDALYHGLETLYPVRKIQEIREEVGFPRARPGRGKTGRGLMTKTMEHLVKHDMAAERAPVEYKVYPSFRRIDWRNLCNWRKEEKDECRRQPEWRKLCGWVAREMLGYVRRWTIPALGSYFFVVSLHNDWHQVTLRAERRGRRLRILWIDQFGERDASSLSTLSWKIAWFVPNYPPTLSAISPLKPLTSPLIQPKLAISEPGDKYEQEADRVADLVMRMPETGMQRRRGEGDRGETETPQRQAGPIQPAAVVRSRGDHLKAIRGSGQPLPLFLRTFFEPRFGRDFTQVRIHTDTQEAEIAQALNAQAFTLGSHIVFGARQFAPETSAGRKLLAHELAHVVQRDGNNNKVFRQAKERTETGEKHYPVTGHPKSPLTLKEISTFIGYPVIAIGKEECEQVEKKYKGRTFSVPILFPKREATEREFGGIFHPLLKTGIFEQLWVKLESGVSIDRWTFVIRIDNSYRIKTYHHVLKDVAILQYSEGECAKHLGRPLMDNADLERQLRQKLVKQKRGRQ